MANEKTTATTTLLDKVKQREVCAILHMGCSRRAAARYVGCTLTSIVATAARDENFRSQLDRAEQSTEIEQMRNIQEAAKKSQYWRAAAWALERRNPEEYGSRGVNTFTMEQVRHFLNQLVEIIIEEVPSATQRRKVLHRFEELMAEVEE